MNNRQTPNRPAPRRTPNNGTGQHRADARPQGKKKVRKHRSTGAVIRNIFIAALAAVIAVFLILFIAGYRYMAYKVVRGEETVTVKYIGRVDKDGNPTSGRVIYPDKQAKVDAKNGTVQYSNGDVYSGGLMKMLKHGTGKLIYDNDDVYEGTFVYDVISGAGTYTYASSGDVYTGAFSEGQRSGEGTMTWSDGSKYEGTWVNGERSGTGKYTAADGSSFEGEYSANKPNGKGTYTYSDGSTYEGDFVDGIRSGTGTYTWASGEKYTGEFAQDKPNGQGTFTWPSGRYFTGKFENGVIVVDSGTAYEPNGEKAE